MSKNTFTVIDIKTGKYPDLEAIALHEDWAKGLVYCDMEGFAIEEDGSLLLMDECNNSRCCPIGRFEVVWEEQEAVEPKSHPAKAWTRAKTLWFCGACGARISKRKTKYCQECGTAVKWT